MIKECDAIRMEIASAVRTIASALERLGKTERALNITHAPNFRVLGPDELTTIFEGQFDDRKVVN